jgi:hypothetical protein
MTPSLPIGPQPSFSAETQAAMQHDPAKYLSGDARQPSAPKQPSNPAPRANPAAVESQLDPELVKVLREFPVQEIKDPLALRGAGSYSRQVEVGLRQSAANFIQVVFLGAILYRWSCSEPLFSRDAAISS